MSFEERMGMEKDVATEAVRETVGSQLLTLAVSISKHAAEVSEATYSRLIDVSREQSPIKEGMSIDVEQWPPFFATLRTSLLQIDDRLTLIQQTINRVEV